MASNDDLITGLMIKYARREKLTDEEMHILEEWWQQSPEHQRMAEQFGDEDWVRAELAKMKPAPMKEMWEEINKYLDEMGAPDDRANPTEWEQPELPPLPGRRWTRPLAVAAVLVMCVAAVWVLLGKSGEKSAGEAAVVVDRQPEAVAKEDGVLLLGSDGRTVELNAAAVGDTVAWMGNVYAKKLGPDRLALYQVDEDAGADGWQAILVGKNRSPYFVRLADGSNVWLGGGARLEYAVAKQEIAEHYRFEGKGFFDVTKDKSRPFVISTPHGRAIEVLGTSFNVETGDADSRVVLLNGKLRVRNGADSAVLRAAQEAVLSPGKTDVHPVRDSAAVVAWVKKSLYFHFSNTSFTDAIAEVASWYGYTVSNPKGLRGIPITDNLRRDPSPESILFKIGEIENPYLYVWVSNKIIYISDRNSAIYR